MWEKKIGAHTHTHSLPNENRHIVHDKAQQEEQCDSMGH